MMRRPHETCFCALLVTLSLIGRTTTSRGVYRISEPTNIQLPPYDETELTCEMNISPDKFQWRFYPLDRTQVSDPNAPLDLSRKHYIDLPQSTTNEKKKSTLIVKLTNTSMAGDYQCLAHYGASILASIPDRITITTLREFPVQDSARVTVTAGNTVVWRCEEPYSNPPAYIDYSKDGDYVVRPLSLTKSLILGNVTKKDAGVYKCKATNTLQEKKEESKASLYLNVVPSAGYEMPKFIVKPKTLYTAKKDDSVFLECGAIGTPIPKVTWMKFNDKLQEKRTRMVPGGLIISNIVPEDEGVYICNSTNTMGTISHSITLMYNEPPSIIHAPKATTINEGERLELECVVKGTPEPQIYWMLNGKSVMSDNAIQAMDRNITFLPIEKRHAGILQCFARNILGMVYRSADLTVIPKQISSTDISEDFVPKTQPKVPKGRKHKKPHKHKGTSQMIPPRKPTISRLNDESVVVRWNVSTNDGLPIQFFKVQYKELGPSNRNVSDRSSRWKTANLDIAPNIRSFEVNNLKPDHIYRFRIAAVYSNNDNKLSQKSDRFHLEKEEFHSKNPLPTPTLTHTEMINATSIQIFWECIPHPNITVDGYFINYMPASSAGDYMRATADGEKTSSFIITHLQPDTVYDIKMQSFNTKTASEFSHILKEKTEKLTTEAPKIETTTKTKGFSEPNTSIYIFIGVGVVVLSIIISVIVSLIICTKWKKDKDADSTRGDRDKPNDGINHHIQAEGNDYVVTPKTLARNNGCALPSSRITITANPLADADNKNNNHSSAPSQSVATQSAEAVAQAPRKKTKGKKIKGSRNQQQELQQNLESGAGDAHAKVENYV